MHKPLNTDLHSAILLAFIIAVTITACTNVWKGNDSTWNSSKVNTRNITKLLNRVTCKDASSNCTQEVINKIWQSCISGGYTTRLPTNQVISSREIQELIRTSHRITRTSTKEVTDNIGIVYTSDNEINITQFDIRIEGYCIGSEYINKN